VGNAALAGLRDPGRPFRTAEFEGMNESQLADALGRVGIKPGDKLVLHSSFKSLEFDGTPAEACHAFMDYLTEKGTLMMVTHTYCFQGRPDAEKVYDRTKTKSEVGAMSDAFFRLPGVIRSLHPTHSVAAWGRGSQGYLAEHHLGETMGKTSPLYKICQDGGAIMMAGCSLSSCTAFHVAEFLAEAPYLAVHCDPSWGREAGFLDEDGVRATYYFHTVPGCSHGFVKAEPELIGKKIVKQVSLNKENTLILQGKKTIEILSALLRKTPFFFKEKDRKNCKHCVETFLLDLPRAGGSSAVHRQQTEHRMSAGLPATSNQPESWNK
jgi:aminoglycoside 3-N-acetyltransferase